jgi:dihydrofolate reductase
MGEIHVNIYSTLDGVIESNGGPDEDSPSGFEYGGWQTPFWDEQSGHQVTADVKESDALLLGRRTYEIFRKAWPSATDEIGQVLNTVPKYVVSRGDPELSWSDTTHLRDATEVAAVREKHRVVHTWGSSVLFQDLLRLRLVDRLNLWVYPVVLGQGQKLFGNTTPPTNFRLLEPAKSFPAGAVLIRYGLAEGKPTGQPMRRAQQ